MLQSESIVRKTNIYCGALSCNVCDTSAARLSSSASTILIVDTNVVLHQIDLLENPAIDDVVVPSLVLEEIKYKNPAVYNRLKFLCTNSLRRFFVFSNEYHRDTYVEAMVGESRNDRNDRAIRVAARWYQSHLGGSTQVLFITNDKENKRKAIEEGLSAETVESYVESLGKPDLLDLVALPTSKDVAMEEVEGSGSFKSKIIYSEHKPLLEIHSGLVLGIYHQGKLRVNRYHPFKAYVRCEITDVEIVIHGRANMNRAFDGDIVVVELLPQDHWHEEMSLIISDREDDQKRIVFLVPGSAVDAPWNTNQVQPAALSTASTSSHLAGCVVGIMKRNWHS